ncbi:MAG: peptidylprolyl isomerase [Planctomycetaceae bacterium]|nr:peptidylprolyl isomerase [Planctomycetaceae bacterium]
MKHLVPVVLLLVLGWGCGGGAEPKSESRTEAKPAMSPEPKPQSNKPEPEHITVAHVLISFAGAGTDAKRSKAEAEKLANDVLARARKGEDFDRLMKDLSDDPGGGAYMMSNLGVRPTNPDEFPRNKMVPAFGDVGFKLEVGGIGMSTFDPRTSPYGWHIIKRLK